MPLLLTSEKRAYEPIDAIDQFSCRPDFGVAVYPGYLNEKKSDAVAASLHFPANTCPIMLVHAGDDTVSNVENSVGMYEALQHAGITTELHIYSAGEHGFGVRKSSMPVSTWTNRCIDWLHSLGVLKSEHN